MRGSDSVIDVVVELVIDGSAARDSLQADTWSVGLRKGVTRGDARRDLLRGECPSPVRRVWACCSAVMLVVSMLMYVTGCATATVDESTVDPQAALKEFLAERSKVILAVLPVQNYTVDRDTSLGFRTSLTQRLRSSGYSTLDTNEVDQAVLNLGVQHPEQIALVSRQQLMDAVRADLAAVGAVRVSTTQSAAGYHAYAYWVDLSIVDRAGNVLWQDEHRVTSRSFAADPLNMILDGMLYRWPEATRRGRAVDYLAQELLRGLPRGPVQMSDDRLLDEAVMVTPAAK